MPGCPDRPEPAKHELAYDRPSDGEGRLVRRPASTAGSASGSSMATSSRQPLGAIHARRFEDLAVEHAHAERGGDGCREEDDQGAERRLWGNP